MNPELTPEDALRLNVLLAGELLAVRLGEPDAVLAVAYAPTLTDELARRAWWASQNGATMEVARVMLAHPAVRSGTMGRVLADYLIEHLPFEEDPIAAMHTVRAVLAAGLLEAAAREQLWAKGKRRPWYLIGFLESLPDALPAEAVRPLPAGLPDTPATRLLARCCSSSGQSYLKAAELALEKPPAHEAVYLLLDLMGAYFAAGRAPAGLESCPAEAAALQALSQLSEAVALPVLTKTTAIGPLMRRHLEPVFAPILTHLRILRG